MGEGGANTEITLVRHDFPHQSSTLCHKHTLYNTRETYDYIYTTRPCRGAAEVQSDKTKFPRQLRGKPLPLLRPLDTDAWKTLPASVKTWKISCLVQKAAAQLSGV